MPPPGPVPLIVHRLRGNPSKKKLPPGPQPNLCALARGRAGIGLRRWAAHQDAGRQSATQSAGEDQRRRCRRHGAFRKRIWPDSRCQITPCRWRLRPATAEQIRWPAGRSKHGRKMMLPETPEIKAAKDRARERGVDFDRVHRGAGLGHRGPPQA